MWSGTASCVPPPPSAPAVPYSTAFLCLQTCPRLPLQSCPVGYFRKLALGCCKLSPPGARTQQDQDGAVCDLAAHLWSGEGSLGGFRGSPPPAPSGVTSVTLERGAVVVTPAGGGGDPGESRAVCTPQSSGRAGMSQCVSEPAHSVSLAERRHMALAPECFEICTLYRTY